MFYKLKLEKFAENEVVEILLNQELSFLHLIWKQHPTGEQFRNGYRTGIDLALKYKVRYWLADARNIYYLAQSDQSWLLAKMSLLLESNRLKKYAILMEPECFLMTQHKPNPVKAQQQEEATTAKKFQVFVDAELAYSWLFNDVIMPKTSISL